MAEIRSIDKIVSKWTRVTPGRQQDFQDGVASPRRDWGSETAAAEPRYVEAVTAAASEGRYGRGVTAVGTQKWKRKVTEVGVQRWGPGVRAGAQDYQTGFRPYAETIAATDPGPKFPAGDPRNIDRVRVLAQALHAKKVGG